MKKMLITMAALGWIGLAGAGTASADELSYLESLQSLGLLAQGGESCVFYPGDSGCSMRFTDNFGALHVGNYSCSQLAAGASVPKVVELLAQGDGLPLNPDNAKLVVLAADKYLC